MPNFIETTGMSYDGMRPQGIQQPPPHQLGNFGALWIWLLLMHAGGWHDMFCMQHGYRSQTLLNETAAVNETAGPTSCDKSTEVFSYFWALIINAGIITGFALGIFADFKEEENAERLVANYLWWWRWSGIVILVFSLTCLMVPAMCVLATRGGSSARILYFLIMSFLSNIGCIFWVGITADDNENENTVKATEKLHPKMVLSVRHHPCGVIIERELVLSRSAGTTVMV